MAVTIEKTVDLDWFVGKDFALTGVDDIDSEDLPEDAPDEPASRIGFVLDGRAYIAVEDPSDGYRSSLDRIFIGSAKKIRNRFKAVRVRGEWADAGEYGSKIVNFVDRDTGKTVLEIGTSNTDDYYPGFVRTFTPENMSVNRSEEERELALQESMAAIKAQDKQVEWGTW